jgi:hypothetical protein
MTRIFLIAILGLGLLATACGKPGPDVPVDEGKANLTLNCESIIVSSDAATKQYVDSMALSVQDKINSIEIPSKTSELENDSNYIAAKIDEHYVSTLNIQHIS